MSERNESSGNLLGRGLLTDNPLLRLGLGICPALAVTTRAADGLGLGIVTACVLLCTSLAVSLLGYIMSDKHRLPVIAALSAVFTTIAHMLLKSRYPALSDDLGVFVPLIAVSALILNRSGNLGVVHNPLTALADALGMGIGYTVVLTLIGAVRELFGSGSLFGARVLPAGYQPMLMLIMPAGGFLVLGLMMGVCNAILGPRRKKEEEP